MADECGGNEPINAYSACGRHTSRKGTGRKQRRANEAKMSEGVWTLAAEGDGVAAAQKDLAWLLPHVCFLNPAHPNLLITNPH